MAKAREYLTKQLFSDKNIVTYRMLSRQCNIHVNEAKNELQAYYSSTLNESQRAHATYVLAGEKFPTSKVQNPNATQEPERMDVDESHSDHVYLDHDGEEVLESAMVLVAESDLEVIKATFVKIHSSHIYCLSPVPIENAELIADSNANVHSADGIKFPQVSTSFGKIVGPDVKIGKVPPRETGTPVPLQSRPSFSSKAQVKKEEESSPASTPRLKHGRSFMAKSELEEQKAASTSTSKPKRAGTLDWSKAKTKTKVEEVVKVKVEEEESSEEEKKTIGSAKIKKEVNGKGLERTKSKGTVQSEAQRRGAKRKIALVTTDTEDEDSSYPSNRASPAAPVASTSKVKKRAIVSDDDEETDVESKPVPKSKSLAKSKSKSNVKREETETERSLRAMMDIDDDEVVKASRPGAPGDQAEQPTEDDDVEMEDDAGTPPPVLKSRKKKEKKVIPVGSNGLKKKRVMKSRMKIDDKGYMATEDYSSYESVDEEEEEVKPKKAAGKAKKITLKNSPPPEKPTKKAAAPLKRTGTGSKGSITNFFGKSGKKS